MRDKVYALIKFRFYDLSERAEEARDQGVALESTVALVSAREQTKQDFNRATTYAKRRALIGRARSDWQKFVKAAKGKEQAADYLDAAWRDLQAVK